MHDEVGELVKANRAISKWLQNGVRACAFLFRHAARFGETVDRRKRNLVLLCVLARRLAERLGRFFDIENVVDNLEREADVLSKAGERGISGAVRARVDRA